MRRRFVAPACLVSVLLAVLGCGGDDDAASLPRDAGPEPDAGRRALLLRDRFGVPHVFADDVRAASYAMGWVEAEDQRDALLLRYYGAVGRASERFGATCGMPCLETDIRVHVDRVREVVESRYATLEPATREVVEAYAEGLNAFFARTPGAWAAYDPADPVTPQMVVASHVAARIAHARAATQADITPGDGSNQLAVTGTRTVPDTTVVLKDPHNLWTGSEPYLHVSVGDYDIVGNGFGGVLGCGSNGFVSFGCTRATPVSAVSVRLRLEYGANRSSDEPCGEYVEARYADHAAAGELVPFAMRCISIAREGQSAFTGWVYDSRFGTLDQSGEDTDGDGRPDEAFVTHVFAATDPSVFDYAVARTYARSATELLGLYAAPTPREDAQYRAFGSREHVIGLVLGASVPALDPAVDWHQPVSAEDSRIDGWTPNADWSVLGGVAFYNVDGVAPELPHVLAPAGDFVQNCNGNPEWATEPIGQIGESPRILESFRVPTNRDERMRQLVLDSGPLDAAGVIEMAADVVVAHGRDLGEAIRCGLAASGQDPVTSWSDGGRLMVQLTDWAAIDYRALPESEAMTVMYLIDGSSSMPRYPAPGECLSAEALDRLGVALRDAVAPAMRRLYGASHDDPLRVPWGHLNYVVVGGVEYGVAGAGGRLATLFVNAFELDLDTGRGDPETHLGSRLTQVTSFGPNGHEVFITSPHGQVDERRTPSSPHVGQTIYDYVARRFRRVPLRRDEVESDLCPYGDPASAIHDPEHEHRTRTELAIPDSP